jgi:hypothetical protein
MADVKKLSTAPISCPVCRRGRAFQFEEQVPAQLAGAKPGEGMIAVPSRFRKCDSCELEFAGQVESSFNKEQVLAVRAAHGAVSFPRSTAEAPA